jgi:hypothetical protein
MAVSDSVDPASFLREQLESASPDLLQAMVKVFAEALMSAEADAICGAGYGQRSDERVNRRNGYRLREWDTRVGTIELAIPKLRQGSYFPDWLLRHRRRAEQALVSVVATSYLLGVSTRRVEKLVEQLGVASLSKAQVSEPVEEPVSTSGDRYVCRSSLWGTACRADMRRGRQVRALATKPCSTPTTPHEFLPCRRHRRTHLPGTCSRASAHPASAPLPVGHDR